MPLNNYTDLSVGGSDISAGFQFEFRCSHCTQSWKSPFKPYRKGQLTGLLNRFAFLIGGSASTAARTTVNFSELGARGAKEQALKEARERADAIYTVCPSCKKPVCADCFDENENACKGCLGANRQREAVERANGHGSGGAAATSTCPNCQHPHAGGRFCAECGFDMSSTHKSCPGCGAMTTRGARFCTDCGHGF